MKVSYQWLKAVAPDLTLSATEVAAQLATRGAPVEEFLDLAEGIKDVVVARVEEAGRHPNADRLSLCKVNAGGELLQVVCGAPNVKSGSYYPFAPAGSTLPGGLKLKKAKIRGEYSEGMLCSPIEIGLGTDHDGIMELSGEPEIGRSLIEALGLDDWRLDVEVTANRGDLLSHVGVAREIAPKGHHSIQLPEIPNSSSPSITFATEKMSTKGSGVSLQIDDSEMCSRYIGVVIRGVKVGPSPEWLQTRLRSVGARPINNVVDATNYVLLELGQPLHAFDLEQIADQSIVVRRARVGEVITTLDGVERKLTADMLAICDAKTPVAIAGVMGGSESEVSDTTTDVLLECAHFDPASTRSTRRDLGMSTDASFRYERGVDPDGMERAVERCVEVILATAGGAIDGAALDLQASIVEPVRISLRPPRVERVLGVAFEPTQIAELLTPLGFDVSRPGINDTVSVAVPGFRRYDVRREIDLIEELARTYGYDQFPEDLAPFRPTTVPDHPLYALEDHLRTLLVHRGAFELQTPAFAATGDIELPNPVSATESHLRASMMPGVLGGLAYNLARGIRDVRLFEIGTVFLAPGASGGLAVTETRGRPEEETRLAAALVGRSAAPHWSSADAGPSDFWDVKAWFEETVALAWPAATIGSKADDGTDPGDPLSWLESGVLLEATVEGRRVGVAGFVRGDSIDTPPWAGSVLGLEVVLPSTPDPIAQPIYRPIAQFPGIERDVALLVPGGVSAGEVLAVIKGGAGSLVESVELFDVYEGDGIEEGFRSLAYRLTFRSAERTLKDTDVEPAVRRVLKRLNEELNVHQRG